MNYAVSHFARHVKKLGLRGDELGLLIDLLTESKDEFDAAELNCPSRLVTALVSAGLIDDSKYPVLRLKTPWIKKDDALKLDLSGRKPLSAVLTLSKAFKRSQEPPSAVKTRSLPSDLASARAICRIWDQIQPGYDQKWIEKRLAEFFNQPAVQNGQKTVSLADFYQHQVTRKFSAKS